MGINKVLLYISICTSIILIIVFVYYLVQRTNIENYVSNQELVAMYQSANASISQKEHSKDIFINSDFYDTSGTIFETTPSETSLNSSIGASNICIYKDDSINNEDMDMECITYSELKNAIDLEKVKFRKETVCIDEECISNKDIRILNDTDGFKLAHNALPNKGNFENISCLDHKNVSVKTCSGDYITNNNINNNIECAANFGTDGNQAHVCPRETPICKDYEYNVQWGHCVNGIPTFTNTNCSDTAKFKFSESSLSRNRINDIANVQLSRQLIPSEESIEQAIH